MFKRKNIYLTLALLIMVGCDLEREILVELPEHEPRLSVEWYVEPGKPFRMTLTESVNYFGQPTLPVIINALVTISFNGITDTLNNSIVIGENSRFYNYISNTTATSSINTTFEIYIRDQQGREATATATSLPAATIDTLELLWNNSNTQASLLTSIADFPGQKNYYRVIIHNGSTSKPSIADSWFNDQISSNGRITIGSQFAFEKGDTAIVTVYHISKEYHDFLRSVRNAQNANQSPFGQPAALQSNINGGIGIFTTIAATKDTLFVK
jgi:hypothetical protein